MLSLVPSVKCERQKELTQLFRTVLVPCHVRYNSLIVVVVVVLPVLAVEVVVINTPISCSNNVGRRPTVE